MAEPPQLGDAFALIREEEGITIIRPGEGWARITLGAPSSLEAVGLTATVASALAARGIAANMIAGHHHDHLFVPWRRRTEALAVLQELSSARAPYPPRPGAGTTGAP